MKLLTIEEVLWQEKARVTWHARGDRNTKNFHMLTLLSSSNEIKNDVYVLNKESALGPLSLVPFSFILIGAPLKLM